jgi:threonine synthase
MVKALFNDHAFRDKVNMSAVNSINWARVMAQIVYYVAGAVALGAPDRPIGFSVPSGNFGNVYAGYGARQMGLDIAPLIVGSNRNDILVRFFNNAAMQITGVEPSLSPSMDIQVSSNLERLLFDLYDRDGATLAAAMNDFRAKGHLTAPRQTWGAVEKLFGAAAYDDEATIAAMRSLYRRTGELIDPHSAIGLAAAVDKRRDPETPIIALGTAHPAKFPDAVLRATGQRPALPEHLADLYDRTERMTVLPNSLDRVKEFVLARRRH